MKWLTLLVLLSGCPSSSVSEGVVSEMHCVRARRFGEEHCFCVYNGYNARAVTWAPMDMCLRPFGAEGGR